ncbi:MAG TPA: dienelactone hydrolase family protein [Terriglobales bacterium]|nr:dienelactone hydrolase family protein [Terriglobales bacterium]
MRTLATRLALAVSLLAVAATAQSAAPWRYDLRAGDHLTYRYTLQREVKGEEAQSQSLTRFQSHVLVAGTIPEHLTLGFQRNRQAAELVLFKVKGKDRLSQELPKFRTRMQSRPAHFAEAMDISPTGEPNYQWEMARESPSHILAVFHEVMTLPPVAVKQGEGWRGATMLSLDFRWVGDESVRGKSCHRVEAASPDGLLKLTYWWSPDPGVIEQVELDGSYSGAGAVFHEIARMELESRTRNESIDGWLHSEETSLGALQAILLGPSIPISTEQLSSVIATDDARSQALALAIADRRKLKLPSAILNQFKQSSNSQLRELAEQEFAPSVPRDEMNCNPVPSPKQSPAKLGTLFDTVPASKTGTEIPYLLRVPLTYREDRPSPLLVYLSGAAGLAMDGVNTAEDVVSGTDYLVLYPHAADYWWKPEVARRFNAVLSQVLANYNVDRDRIYLTGFSNGGTGSLYFAELWPERFAAVVSLMGAGQCMEQVKQGLSNLENLPLLFVHGEKDPLIGPECSTTTHAALTDLHPAFKPVLEILPDREHDITLTSDDGLALAFFKDKVRNPFPKHIDFAFTDAQAPRSYWIEILDGKPGKSGVEARVKLDNTIDIRSRDVKRLRLFLRPELMPKQTDIRIEWNGKKMFQGALQNICTTTANVTTGDPKLDLSDRKDFSLP